MAKSIIEKMYGRKRETLPVPTRKEVKDASPLLKAGHSSAGRVMSEQAKAKRKPKNK